MTDIFSDLPIRAPRGRVYDAVSTPDGLDAWWTKGSAGKRAKGEEFKLWFGPDWLGTRVGFLLDGQTDLTQIRFYHTGWPTANEHWRLSCYCWPIYLRLLRRHVEHGEFVPYEKRLDA